MWKICLNIWSEYSYISFEHTKQRFSRMRVQNCIQYFMMFKMVINKKFSSYIVFFCSTNRTFWHQRFTHNVTNFMTRRYKQVMTDYIQCRNGYDWAIQQMKFRCKLFG